MRRLCRRLLAASLFLTWAQPSAAQTVEEIVERHLAASGGRAVLEAVTSRALTGTITVQVPGGEISGTFEMVNQAPNRQRTLITIDLAAVGGGTMVQDERFDGTSGYVLDSFQGNRELVGNQRENIRNEVFPTPLLDYARRGDAVELAGREKVGERDAYLLVLRPATGPPIRRYIDAESYLEIRLVQRAEAPQVGEFDLTLDLLDYRDVGGVKIPFLVRGSSSFQTFTVTISAAEHNPAIDQALFARPY